MIIRTFLGKSDLYVDHVDGNKENNELNNLEYVTPKENCIRAWEKGLSKRKKNNIDQCDLQGNLIATWFNCGDIERELNFNHSNIIKCCKGKAKTYRGFIWKYHTEQ